MRFCKRLEPSKGSKSRSRDMDREQAREVRDEEEASSSDLETNSVATKSLIPTLRFNCSDQQQLKKLKIRRSLSLLALRCQPMSSSQPKSSPLEGAVTKPSNGALVRSLLKSSLRRIKSINYQARDDRRRTINGLPRVSSMINFAIDASSPSSRSKLKPSEQEDLQQHQRTSIKVAKQPTTSSKTMSINKTNNSASLLAKSPADNSNSNKQQQRRRLTLMNNLKNVNKINNNNDKSNKAAPVKQQLVSAAKSLNMKPAGRQQDASSKLNPQHQQRRQQQQQGTKRLWQLR